MFKRPPNSRSTVAPSDCTEASTARSAAQLSQRTPAAAAISAATARAFSSALAAIQTDEPCCASASAIARPNPDAPPTTSAVAFLKSNGRSGGFITGSVLGFRCSEKRYPGSEQCTLSCVRSSDGKLESINTSRGGVPKTAVFEAIVTREGIVGDVQRDLRYHGGPERAVSIYSLDLIADLQREGHPIAPGSAGENLTVSGVDWSLLVPGCELQVGDVRL